MIEVVKKHYLALCIALLLGGFTAVPQLLAINSLGDDWLGIYPINNDDELYYQARVHEVNDGFSTISQPYLKEGKDGIPLQFWIPDNIFGQIGKILNISVQNTFVLFDFVSPIFLYLIFYAIGIRVLKDKLLALSFSLILSAVIFFGFFNRPVSPQVTLVPLLLFVLTFFSFVKKGGKKHALLATLFFGLTFHMYTYYWTYAVVFLGIFFGFVLLKRKFEFAKQIFFIGLGGLLIGLPYFIQLLKTMNLDEYHETVIRLGMLHTRMPSGLLIVGLSTLALILMIAAFTYRGLSSSLTKLCIFSFVLATPIVANHHIVTGQNLEFSSHYRILGIIFPVLAIFLIFKKYIKKYPLRRKYVSIFVFGLITAVAFSNMVYVAQVQSTPTKTFMQNQRYGELINWINQNIKEEGNVLFANKHISAFIPAYTSQNVFYAREANLHFMTDEEVKQRYVLSNYFRPNLSPEMIRADERSIFGTKYLNAYGKNSQNNKFRSLFGVEQVVIERLPLTALKGIQHKWLEVSKKEFNEAFNKQYSFDYLVWDMVADPNWNIYDYSNEFTLVFENKEFKIFKKIR